MEICPNFNEVDLTGMSRKQWEARVVMDSIYSSVELIYQHRKINKHTFSNFRYPYQTGRDYSIFKDIYGFEEGLGLAYEQDLGISEGYRTRKNKYYADLASEAKRGNYQLYRRLENALRSNHDQLDTLTYDVLRLGMTTLYLMFCDPSRFLVGLKDGTHWKKVRLEADPTDVQEHEVDLIGAGMLLTAQLPIFGSREMLVVPDMLMNSGNLDKVKMPKPDKKVEDLLEEAYHGQRYMVPPEGAEIRFRKAGDLTKIYLLQWDRAIVARVVTTYGEYPVWLDLESGLYRVPLNYELSAGPEVTDAWASITAETYRDLVTADEISTTQYRSLRTSRRSQLPLDPISERIDPQIIYIPRKVKVPGETIEPRFPYSDPSRSVTPHKVSGFIRRGNMTVKHEKELRKLELKLGIKFVDQIPAGRTLVRPYISPAFSADSEIMEGPIFIKRRIGDQIRRLFDRPSTNG